MRQLQYAYPVEMLSLGASLGNGTAWATLDRFSNLRGLWNSADNRYYAGEWTLSFEADGAILEPTVTTFRPEAQTTVFSDGQLQIEKTMFIPFSPLERSAPVPLECKSVIVLLRLRNTGPVEKAVTCRHRLVFPAVPNELFTKQPPGPDTEIRVSARVEERKCVVTTIGRPLQARIFGSAIPWKSFWRDDREAQFDYALKVEGNGGITDAAFVLAFSEQGEEAALTTFNKCEDAKEILKSSGVAYTQVLSRSELITPEPVINRGLLWAKVNTLRVQHKYRSGLAFTNDPPQDIVVIRDLGWYVLGADYITPEFCEGLLEFGERYGYHEEGKLTEFLHADEETPVRHDYKLNINDDTPLFIEALYHHAVTCQTEAHLGRVYGLMRRASDWILSQRVDGLVRCTAEGTSVWGICGWRNIIEGYNLTGVVTEINAECCHALRLTALMASRLEREEEAERFATAAETLKEMINKFLISDETHLYVLNLDNAGVAHGDVTGDLVFPVLYEVADATHTEQVLKVLSSAEMWTPWGVRTVHPADKRYDPEFGYQLVGGVWPNLTAWISYCLREKNPEKMVEGTINIFSSCEPKSPVQMGRIVPGEFPERFHGEKRVSLGMPLSPWMPPTYIWLGLEGLLGAFPNLSGLDLNPCLPAAWEWIAVRNLLFRGKPLDAFLFRGTLYSTSQVTTRFPLRVGDHVETSTDAESIFPIALRLGDETLLFVCSDTGGSGTVVVHTNSMVIKKEVQLQQGGATLIGL